MTARLKRRLHFLLLVFPLLLFAVPAYSHNLPVGGSRWCVGSKGIEATIDLNQTLLAEIGGVKERQYDLAAGSDQQLEQLAREVLQPYLDKKLSLSLNGKRHPLKLDKLVRNDNATFTIWLSTDRISFEHPENTLKIEYRLLFAETGNAHLNLAYFYRSAATGDALQKVFDFSPPEGHFSFSSDSAVWELSVPAAPGTAAAPSPLAAAAPGPGAPTGGPVQSAARGAALASAHSDGETADRLMAGTVSPGARPGTPAAALPETGRIAQNPASAPLPPKAQPGNAASGAGEPGSQKTAWSEIGRFILLGIEHILTGYDHIAFLVGLIVIGLSTREVLKIITAFTIAHSLTLLLAALQIVTLNSRFVESVIALSICYIALENIFRKEVKYRWVVTFCFGLVHGFGFASALQELIVGKNDLVVSVLSFNFGVETGQLMIFFLLLPVLHLLKQKLQLRWVTAAVSTVIFLLGLTWLVERLFDLNLIS